MITNKQTHVTNDFLIEIMVLWIPGRGNNSGKVRKGFPTEKLSEVGLFERMNRWGRVLLEREKEWGGGDVCA